MRLIGVAAALALLIGASYITTGQLRAAAPETITTILYPGDNLVGWIEPAAPVEQVFAALPRLRSVRSEGGREARADLVGEPDTGQELRTLETGSGYWFRVVGSTPVVWQRTPSAGSPRLDLAPGRQFVAWSGRGGIRLRSAVRGIEDAVRWAYTWNAAAQRFRVWSPAAPQGFDLPIPAPAQGRPSFAHFDPRLQQGQAIGVVLREEVQWRQPSGALPAIKFHGEVPEQIRRQARADTRWVVDYFIDRFGVEAAPERLQILVWATPEDIFSGTVPAAADIAASAHIPEDPGRSVTSILMGMHEWAPLTHDSASGQLNQGRLVLLHEYYHAVQGHLAGSSFHDVPGWFSEGGPTWLMYQQVGSRHNAQRDLEVAAQFGLGVDELPTSLSQESDGLILGASPMHAMGHAVALYLNDQFGADAHFRYWRNAAKPQLAGVGFPDVLEYSYGLDVEALVEEHQGWMRERYPLVRGTVLAPDRIDVSGLYLGVQGALSTAVLQLPIEADGSFQVALAAGGRYRFALSSADRSCSGYSTANGVVGDFDSAPEFEIERGGLHELTITVPDDFCLLYLRGQVSAPNAESLAELHLTACRRGTQCGHGLTDDAGRFEVLLPGPGEYTLALAESSFGCELFYRDGATVPHQGRASRITITSESAPPLSIELPTPICGYLIRGRLTGLPQTAPQMPMFGSWDNELYVYAFPSGGGNWAVGELLGDGSFRIAVAGPGTYRLEISPAWRTMDGPYDTCVARFRSGRDIYATDVRVAADGHAPIVWEVADDFCRWRASGRVVGPDNEGLTGFWISACEILPNGVNSSCGAATYTDADGRFDFYIPYHGEFFVAPTRRLGCGSNAFYNYRVSASMNGADVTGLKLQVTEEVCSDESGGDR